MQVASEVVGAGPGAAGWVVAWADEQVDPVLGAGDDDLGNERGGDAAEKGVGHV